MFVVSFGVKKGFAMVHSLWAKPKMFSVAFNFFAAYIYQRVIRVLGLWRWAHLYLLVLARKRLTT